jgi:hypothetical protein
MISSLKRIALNVGDVYKCPENHEAKIVWISENRKLIGVKCSHKHFSKVTKVADHTKSRTSYGRYPSKEKKVFVRNMVFLISI